MKKSLLIIIGAFLTLTSAFSQTTAKQFSGLDCNNNPVDLFADLEAGKVVLLHFYMPNCGSCPPPAHDMQTMGNNINANNPGKVIGYAFPYNNTTTCSSVNSWVTTNNLPIYTPMDSGAVHVAYYGGFGMPTVVVLGGLNHEVLFVTQNFQSSDTTTIKNKILGYLASTNELQKDEFNTQIFPNPSSDFVNLSFENSIPEAKSHIEIINLEGKSVLSFQEETLAKGQIKKEINLSKLQSGTYFIQLHLDGKISTKQLIITH